MPIIYETTAMIAEDGHLTIDLKDLPFEKGTQFLIKLIPQLPVDTTLLKSRMQKLTNECTVNNPYKSMTKEEILVNLRRQREEMYRDHTEDLPGY